MAAAQHTEDEFVDNKSSKERSLFSGVSLGNLFECVLRRQQ